VRLNLYIRNAESKVLKVTSIYFSAIWNSMRLIFPAGESIRYSDWDKNKFRPKQNAQNAALIARLNKLEQRIRDAFEKLEREHGREGFTPKMLKEEIQGPKKIKRQEQDKHASIRVVDFIQQFMDNTRHGKRLSTKKLRIKSDSVKPYGNVKLACQEFEEHIKRRVHLHQVSQDLIDAFEMFLIEEKKLAVNTRTKYLQMFMVVMKYANKMKLLSNDALSSLKIAVITEESDSIYLNDKEITAFMDYKNSDNRFLEFIRDMFVIGCYSGLRHSDFSRLTENNFFENRIRTIQKKVGEKVVIPIHPKAKEIIGRYSEGFPYKCPKSTQKFNEYIKEVAKTISCLDVDIEKRITKGSEEQIIVRKKYDWVTSHVCRRSFCTNEIMAGTSIDLIMAVSGHKSYKSFYAYVKATAEEKADAIEKTWQTRYQ
jgi:integrase